MVSKSARGKNGKANKDELIGSPEELSGLVNEISEKIKVGGVDRGGYILEDDVPEGEQDGINDARNLVAGSVLSNGSDSVEASELIGSSRKDSIEDFETPVGSSGMGSVPPIQPPTVTAQIQPSPQIPRRVSGLKKYLIGMAVIGSGLIGVLGTARYMGRNGRVEFDGDMEGFPISYVENVGLLRKRNEVSVKDGYNTYVLKDLESKTDIVYSDKTKDYHKDKLEVIEADRVGRDYFLTLDDAVNDTPRGRIIMRIYEAGNELYDAVRTNVDTPGLKSIRKSLEGMREDITTTQPASAPSS